MLSFAAVSAPQFVVGILLLYVFSVQLGWFPIGGYGTFAHLVLPAVTLGILGGGWYSRMSRSSMIEVLGQDYIQTARAKLDNPNKPIGVFMLFGTSGVGKTETALALAESLYGGEQNVITINMSEFQEAHTVSTLKGAPPGYVGYG